MAGNGTIGLEILEDLPDVDTILIPWGGGGLACGIATAVKAIRPACRILATEVATAAPLTASLTAGNPQTVTYTPSFVDGAGARFVLEPMWPRLQELVDEAVSVTLDEAAAATRLLAERVRVIAEGAGALSTAAALKRTGTIVAVVSGGNIDFARLTTILQGGTP